ncbi:CynX/NimT family MFS transporter [Streptacidiphilus fuscans]|uniref:MFS transporter n=1 Tax=Streptacidiphilus fuscans TaxID=2789292 RepID=A0A931BAR6_9ACTN|nr:MFS transporter [Streptacidiphilus fuscans]MBF9070838.1 MFS transporter [Streptacidiphilus fuscans]
MSRSVLETPVSYAPAPSASRLTRVLAHPATALAGILLVSLNMRAAVSAVSPLLGDISSSYHLSSTAGGLLTTIPVLMMGAIAPVAARLVRRFGAERVVGLALVVLVAGVLLRIAPGAWALFAGSMVLGAAIALLNVTMPGLVKRDFPDRAAAMTGVYTTSMIFGATLAAALSVPFEHAFGGWQGSMASWSVLAVIAFAAWLPQLSASKTRGVGAGAAASAPSAGKVPGLWKHPLAWQLAVFMGIQSLLSYTLIAWLPTVLTTQGMDRGTAGIVFAVSSLVQIPAAFLIPLAAGRTNNQRMLVVLMVGSMATGVAGLLVAPTAGAWVWATLIGVAQGGGFGLAMAMIVLRSGSAQVAAQLSGMSQLVGYFIAASGPVGFGALHQATGGWTLPLAVLLAACAVGVTAGLGAGRKLVLSA